MFKLAPLPFAKDALEPHVSVETLACHYGKHHKAYVDKVNELTKGTDLADLDLVALIRKAARDTTQKTLFNNAAQVWNHDFYWQSLAPDGGGEPGGALAERIERDFGGYDNFRKTFSETAVGQFGSGYCWLVCGADGKLKIQATANAETPIADGKDVPLLTTDVWEHAYYLDYQNRRADYLDTFLDHLVNWAFAEANLAAVTRRQAAA
ncbi:MAG: superoxide dismutase [Parvibaculum sp.]|uniref:superoxide dismutase n=1 Tax=Parvibaculum sp. TaxID=2024848 RepID=UPI0027213AE4|nr:superoxide dismutase [Parvibaculum sp.]MDO8839198.1 superoxide dismutase [Parvibaculum sp.]